MNQVTPCFSSKSLMTQAAKQGGDFWCFFWNWAYPSWNSQRIPKRKIVSQPPCFRWFRNYDETCSPYLFAIMKDLRVQSFQKKVDIWTHLEVIHIYVYIYIYCIYWVINKRTSICHLSVRNCWLLSFVVSSLTQKIWPRLGWFISLTQKVPKCMS